nr:GPI-anchored protein LORELEI-like [Ipomoea batatas]
MELGHSFCLSFFLLLSLSLFAGFSSSSSISDGVFVSQSSTGRNLLQAKKDGVFVSQSSTGRNLLQAKKGTSFLSRSLMIYDPQAIMKFKSNVLFPRGEN